MEGCHYKASVPLPDLAMLSCHPEIGVKQLLGGDPSLTQSAVPALLQILLHLPEYGCP